MNTSKTNLNNQWLVNYDLQTFAITTIMMLLLNMLVFLESPKSCSNRYKFAEGRAWLKL